MRRLAQFAGFGQTIALLSASVTGFSAFNLLAAVLCLTLFVFCEVAASGLSAN